MKAGLNYRNLFLLIFLVCFSILFLAEGPFKKTRVADFSSLIPQDLLIEDAWYGIYFQETFVGYSHFSMRVQDIKEGGGYSLKNTSHLKLPILGNVESLNLNFEARLLSNYDLKEAYLKIRSKKYFFEGALKKIKGKSYLLKTATPSQVIQKSISIKEEFINSFFAPMPLARTPLSKKVSFSFYDPFFDRRTPVVLKNKGSQDG